MSREFRMPSLGADMEAGTLVEWRVQPGSTVHKGDIVALVDTEKGVIDIESFEEGVIERLSVKPGTRVPVGTPMAYFEGEAAPGPISEKPAEPAAPVAPAGPAGPMTAPAPAAAAVPVVTARSGERQRISPAARARAAALGVDVATLSGTGPQGALTLQDIERAARGAPADVTAGQLLAAGASAAPAPPAERGTMRAAIAASMSRAKREIPHYYLQLTMDMSPAVHWLEAFNSARPVPERLLMAVLLIKATAKAAAEKRGFNGTFGPKGFEPAATVNTGVAIALRGGGLVAPALTNVNSKALPVLMRELQELVGRVRSGHMRSSEVASATLTITSLGDEGVDALYPIIYPPQVAMVGFGSIVERPWVVAGQVEPRPVMTIALAADHRVTDGRLGAQFLARIRDHLTRPAEL